MKVTRIGVDIAKNVFQVHGVDRSGAHHWARELKCKGFEVRLIPPQYVKPYVK